MGMKKTAWLTRKVLVRGIAALATGGAAIALVYGVQSGNVKDGFGADKTITKSEKRDKQGTVVETTTATTFQDAKTLWDLLSLAGVPLSLAILGYVLQLLQQTRAEQQAKAEKEIADQRAKAEKKIVDQQEKAEKEIASQRTKTEKEIAESNQGEEALQNYLDRLSDLLIDKNVIAIAVKLQHLQKDFKDFICDQQNSIRHLPIELQEITRKDVELVNAAKDIIRARTLSILRRLGQDGERKGDIIRFLIEAEVISKLKLNLSSANLSSVRLSSANLRNADLFPANLSSARLICADLSHADLTYVILSGANLYRADLSHTNLSNADLSGTNLSNTNLSYATLNGAKNWNETNLPLAKLCKTKLPEGCDLNPNRDCEALGISLDPPETNSPE